MGLPIIGAIAEVQNMPGFRAAIREVNSSLAGVGQGASQIAAGIGGAEGAGGLIAAGATAAVVSGIAAAAAAAAAALLAMSAALAAVGAHGIQVNAQLERVGIQLESLTGLGQENLEWAKELAVTTPFTPDSVAKALQMATAYGFQGEQAKELVKTTADVSAAFGDQGDRMHRILIALGQMHGAQRINAQDMRQLTEAGINAWQILAEASGVSIGEIRQQVEEGMVASDFAVGVFTEALQEKFGGAAERASDSMLGVVGNIQNILDIASAEVTVPLFEVLRDTLVGVRDALLDPMFQNAVEEFAMLVEDIAAGIDPAAIVGAFMDITAAAAEAIGFIREFTQGLSGMTSADVLEDAADDVERNTARMQTSLARMANAHAATIGSMNDQITDAAGLASSKLEDIASRYEDRTSAINERLGRSASEYADRVDKLNRDLERKLEDHQRQLDERLVSLAEDHAEKRASIEQSIADKIEDYNFKLEDMQTDTQDKITDVHERYGERREDLEEQLNEAITDAQRESILDQIAELDAAEQKEVERIQTRAARDEERLKRDHDRAIEALRRKAEAEDLEYAKEVKKTEERSAQEEIRIKEDNELALQELQKKHAQESGEIGAQLAKLQAQRAEEEQAVKDTYDRQVQALKDRIKEEDEAYAEQTAKLIEDTEARNERIKQLADEGAASTIRSWGSAIGVLAALGRGDIAGAISLLVRSGLAEALGDFMQNLSMPSNIVGGLIGSGLADSLIQSPTSTTPSVADQSGPGVVVQGGSTTVDKRINVNANYSKTQSPTQIRQDLQLAAMLQRG